MYRFDSMRKRRARRERTKLCVPSFLPDQGLGSADLKTTDDIVGVIPAAGRGKRIAPLPCSKELYPVGFVRMNMAIFGPRWLARICSTSSAGQDQSGLHDPARREVGHPGVLR